MDISWVAWTVAVAAVKKVPAMVVHLDYVKVYSMVDVWALLKADC
jgi:hypothetical protein